MDDQSNEIHSRVAAQPFGELRFDARERELALEHGRRVVVPQLRDHDQPGKQATRDDAEVADGHSDAREDPMQRLVHPIAELEEPGFTAARALGKHDPAVSRLPHGLD